MLATFMHEMPPLYVAYIGFWTRLISTVELTRAASIGYYGRDS